MPGMTSFTPLPGSSISSPQMLDVSPSKLREQRGVERQAVARQRVVEDDPVGSSRERHAIERVLVPDDVLAGAVHGAQACSAGQHERAVDVEEDEAAGGHGRMGHWDLRCRAEGFGLRLGPRAEGLRLRSAEFQASAEG